MVKKKAEKKEERKQPNSFLRYTGMASQMAVIILIGVFGGIELDEYFEWETPVFTLICSLLAVAASMYLVIKDLNS